MDSKKIHKDYAEYLDKKNQLEKSRKNKLPLTYELKHRKLFYALFEGVDINSEGKVVVEDVEWDWTDPIVQHFSKKIRRIKENLEEMYVKELKSIFGKDWKRM
jgi:hypothetical protein